MRRAIQTTLGVRAAAPIPHHRRTRTSATARIGLLCAEEGRGGHGGDRCSRFSSSSSSSNSSRSRSIWRWTMHRSFLCMRRRQFYLFHLFRTSSPRPQPASRPSSPPAALIIPCIDIPQHENTPTPIPRSTPVPRPTGIRGFSPRPVLFLSTVYHHHCISYTI